MGLLLGIIGVPFGVLIGGATGLMVGPLYDLADYEETDSALDAISSSIQVGRTRCSPRSSRSPEVVDAAMSGVGGTVLRRPVTKIAVAEEAERKPSAKPARSCSVRATSTTKRPSMHGSRR
jgi:hypothetical protein